MDVFRACGIILMVMGHIGFGDRFDKFIHAFHMPMFFFISGFFYKKSNISIKAVIAKKSRTLIIPYFFFGIFHYLISLKDGISIKPLLHVFTINTMGFPIAGALWFLTALFAADVIYAVLDKFNKKWLILPLVLMGSFADRILPYPLPWALSASFVGLGLYWFGEYTRRNEDKLQKILSLKIWEILIIGAITGILIFVNGNVNMREGIYSFFPLFWINALSACFVGISLSKYIEKVRLKPLTNWLMSIGKNSIIYVCLNQLTILWLKKWVPNEVGFAKNILVFVGTMAVLYVLSMIFTKTKLCVLIGKV